MLGHIGNKMFRRGVERNHIRLAANEALVSAETEFWARDHILDNLDTFKYLIQILSFDESKWPSFAKNL